MAKQLSTAYGDALFQAAIEDNRLDALYEEAVMIREIFREEEDLGKILRHPKIPKEEKLQVIRNIFDERVSGEMAGLLYIVVQKDRQKEIPAILDYFIHRVKEHRGIGTAYVTSPFALTQDQKKRLEDRLLQTTEYRSFEMEYRLDPALLGGLVIRIGDRIYDSSLKTQLSALRKDLYGIRL